MESNAADTSRLVNIVITDGEGQEAKHEHRLQNILDHGYALRDGGLYDYVGDVIESVEEDWTITLEELNGIRIDVSAL
jgi:hypothetical protein